MNIVNGTRQYVGRLIRLEFYMRSTKEEQGWILFADLDKGLRNTDYGIRITEYGLIYEVGNKSSGC